MPLPTSGTITMAQIRTELGGGFSDIDIGAELPRLLARKETGPISLSDFYGKSCAVYQVMVDVHPSSSVLVAFVQQPLAGVGGGDSGSMSPNNLFKGWRISRVGTVEPSGNFNITFPQDPINGVGDGYYHPPGFFYAIHFNGNIFYESAASVSGAGGGIHSATWVSTMQLVPGQTYTMRIMY